MVYSLSKATLAGAALVALAGCFNEPEPAYKIRPEGAEVRLNDLGLDRIETRLDPEVVVYINLDRNNFSVLPQEVLACKKLKWLRINSNRLSGLPDLSELRDLRRIYLKNNRFTEVPATLGKLEKLTDIDLSGNPVREVPDWLAKKRGLKNLSFTRTLVRQLPDDLSAWRDLDSLQLGDLDLSAEEMARIRKALPKVAIVF